MGDNDVDINFFNLVISLSQAAMLGMGKISNPHTGETDKNLDIAKVNIDILQMIKEKTVGNLSKKEDEVVGDTLANLQLTYADEMKKDAEQKKTESEKPESSAEESGSPEEEKKE